MNVNYGSWKAIALITRITYMDIYIIMQALWMIKIKCIHVRNISLLETYVRNYMHGFSDMYDD